MPVSALALDRFNGFPPSTAPVGSSESFISTFASISRLEPAWEPALRRDAVVWRAVCSFPVVVAREPRETRDFDTPPRVADPRREPVDVSTLIAELLL